MPNKIAVITVSQPMSQINSSDPPTTKPYHLHINIKFNPSESHYNPPKKEIFLTETHIR